MVTPFYLPGIPRGEEDAHVERLQLLVDTLRRYAAEGGPTPGELADAPIITAWSAVPDAVATRLLGHVTGHPIIGPGPGITARVVASDSSRGWMRSTTRLWRLGLPLTVVDRRQH